MLLSINLALEKVENMQPVQDNMARAFIERLDREVEIREQEGDDGYNWRVPGSDKIMGFVRFNIRGDNVGHYAIYPNNEFDDPRELFVNNHAAQRPSGWVAFVHPLDVDNIRYVRRILRGIIDRQ